MLAIRVGSWFGSHLGRHIGQLCPFHRHASNASQSLSALRFAQRRTNPSKKRAAFLPDKGQGSLVGYSTAENYNLLTLEAALEEQGLYEVHALVDDLVPLCLYAKPKYNVDGGKEIFFFEHGSVIFWDVPQLERDNVLNFLQPIGEQSYSVDTVFGESERVHYTLTEEKTSFKNGMVSLNVLNDKIEKYAFSNAVAASVKLGALEAGLDQIIDSIEHISEDMKQGKSIKLSREEVLKKTGEIFALRHVLNLSLDLLDTPDFYWDRDRLETLYIQTCAHLTIAKRTRIMNEKLTHCYELVDLISNHLNDEHHVRLEWFIIVLIMIEVVFEILHFAERYFWKLCRSK